MREENTTLHREEKINKLEKKYEKSFIIMIFELGVPI
jgi:hypothetical protein